jgi:hypothetical protein
MAWQRASQVGQEICIERPPRQRRIEVDLQSAAEVIDRNELPNRSDDLLPTILILFAHGRIATRVETNDGPVPLSVRQLQRLLARREREAAGIDDAVTSKPRDCGTSRIQKSQVLGSFPCPKNQQWTAVGLCGRDRAPPCTDDSTAERESDRDLFSIPCCQRNVLRA